MPPTTKAANTWQVSGEETVSRASTPHSTPPQALPPTVSSHWRRSSALRRIAHHATPRASDTASSAPSHGHACTSPADSASTAAARTALTIVVPSTKGVCPSTERNRSDRIKSCVSRCWLPACDAALSSVRRLASSRRARLPAQSYPSPHKLRAIFLRNGTGSSARHSPRRCPRCRRSTRLPLRPGCAQSGLARQAFFPGRNRQQRARTGAAAAARPAAPPAPSTRETPPAAAPPRCRAA